MNYEIRALHESDIEEVVHFSLLAWKPVFQSFETILGSAIFKMLYPEWKAIQSQAVEGMIRDTDKYSTWVAVVGGAAVGFIAYKTNMEEKTGEVEMLAVHPDFQNAGIGTALNELVLQRMRGQGILLAEVGTGGDPGHAPARRCYEKAGYTGLPIVRYYKNLSEIPVSGGNKNDE